MFRFPSPCNPAVSGSAVDFWFVNFADTLVFGSQSGNKGGALFQLAEVSFLFSSLLFECTRSTLKDVALIMLHYLRWN